MSQSENRLGRKNFLELISSGNVRRGSRGPGRRRGSRILNKGVLPPG